MSWRLVNRHGYLSLPLIFILNVAVSVTVALLVYISELAAVVLAFGYTWYLCLQTKLMVTFIVVCFFGGMVISGFSPDVTQYQTVLATVLLIVSTVVSHAIAYTFTKITGI